MRALKMRDMASRDLDMSPCIIKQSIIIKSSRDNEADLVARLDNKAIPGQGHPIHFCNNQNSI